MELKPHEQQRSLRHSVPSADTLRAWPGLGAPHPRTAHRWAPRWTAEQTECWGWRGQREGEVEMRAVLQVGGSNFCPWSPQWLPG